MQVNFSVGVCLTKTDRCELFCLSRTAASAIDKFASQGDLANKNNRRAVVNWLLERVNLAKDKKTSERGMALHIDGGERHCCCRTVNYRAPRAN